MEKQALNRNVLRKPTSLLATGLAAVAFSATGCTEPTPSSPSPEPGMSDAANEAIEELQCYGRNNPMEDCDKDMISNLLDRAIGRDDNADDDSDKVINQFDKYPGFNDFNFDIDSDGKPDFQDTFFGNNFEDADGDGLMNGLDSQPYIAPPSGVAVLPPQHLSETQLTEALLLEQMGRKYTLEILAPDEPDDDLDGINNDDDPTPTEYTNDRDGDNDSDFYDPEPGDPYIDSRNDPYDPRNDEYWED